MPWSRGGRADDSRQADLKIMFSRDLPAGFPSTVDGCARNVRRETYNHTHQVGYLPTQAAETADWVGSDRGAKTYQGFPPKDNRNGQAGHAST
jgi:hypothetical protein